MLSQQTRTSCRWYVWHICPWEYIADSGVVYVPSQQVRRSMVIIIFIVMRFFSTCIYDTKEHWPVCKKHCHVFFSTF